MSVMPRLAFLKTVAAAASSAAGSTAVAGSTAGGNDVREKTDSGRGFLTIQLPFHISESRADFDFATFSFRWSRLL
jgi:hypothetical protein